MPELITAPDWSAYSAANHLLTPPVSDRSVFLAGTIDMGNSEDWQSKVIEQLRSSWFKYIFNPRRQDWDPSWKQEMENQEFNEQVTWELDHLEMATHAFFNFEANSKSPVTMLELGERLAKTEYSRQTILVVCPREFYRSGNIDIMCARYAIPVYRSLDEGLEALFEHM